MYIWGLDSQKLEGIALDLGLEIENGRSKGRAYAFRLCPPSSRSRYARVSPNPWGKPRHIKACCYHAFRDYIGRAFQQGATRVQSTGGDWRSLDAFKADLSRLHSQNVGSQMYPASMGELCRCEAYGIDIRPGGGAFDCETWARVSQDHRVQFSRAEPDGEGGVRIVNVASIRQADIARCPFAIMVPAHYRPDGSCKCDDPAEQAMMIKEWGYTRASFTRARRAGKL